MQAEIDMLKMNETHLTQIVWEKTDIIATQNAEINMLRGRLQEMEHESNRISELEQVIKAMKLDKLKLESEISMLKVGESPEIKGAK